MKTTASQCDIWKSGPWCSTPQKESSVNRDSLLSSPIKNVEEMEEDEEEIEEPEPDLDDEEYKPSDESFNEAQEEHFLRR